MNRNEMYRSEMNKNEMYRSEMRTSETPENRKRTIRFLTSAMMLIAVVVICFNSVVGLASSLFTDTGTYTSGDAVIDKPVHNLQIDWVSGVVHIAYHKENTIEIREQAKKSIPKDKRMQWKLDGDTLQIRYEKPGLHLFSTTSQEKELTVTLPEGSILGDVIIDATSGTLDIPAIQAENLSLDVTSGDIEAAVQAKKATCKSTSGAIHLQITGDAEEIITQTTSGDIQVEGENVNKMQAETTSGKIDIHLDKADILDASSTSGNIKANVREAGQVKTNSTSGNEEVSLSTFDTLSMDATSGDLKAALSTEPGFRASLEMLSGDLSYDLPLTKQGKEYICGDGSGKVTMETTSGNIMLTTIDEG